MANMTVSGVKALGGQSRIRSATWTHTAAGTAAGTVASSFVITGRLLRVYTDAGGDASWDLTLTASGSTIWSLTALGTSAQTFPLGICYDASTPDAATDATMWGIPLAGEALTVTTANMSGSGTGPAITIVWEESDTV